MQLQQYICSLPLYCCEHPVALVGVLAVQGMPDQDPYDSQESVEDSK